VFVPGTIMVAFLSPVEPVTRSNDRILGIDSERFLAAGSGGA
jgi:hypothetical protein